MTLSNERDNHSRPASPLERSFLTDGRHTCDDFPDPFGEHDIECWVWDGERLLPASEREIQAFEEVERARAAQRHLAIWQGEEQRRVRSWRTHAAAGLLMLARIPHGLRARRASATSEDGEACVRPATSVSPETTP